MGANNTTAGGAAETDGSAAAPVQVEDAIMTEGMADAAFRQLVPTDAAHEEAASGAPLLQEDAAASLPQTTAAADHVSESPPAARDSASPEEPESEDDNFELYPRLASFVASGHAVIRLKHASSTPIAMEVDSEVCWACGSPGHSAEDCIELAKTTKLSQQASDDSSGRERDGSHRPPAVVQPEAVVASIRCLRCGGAGHANCYPIHVQPSAEACATPTKQAQRSALLLGAKAVPKAKSRSRALSELLQTAAEATQSTSASTTDDLRPAAEALAAAFSLVQTGSEGSLDACAARPASEDTAAPSRRPNEDAAMPAAKPAGAEGPSTQSVVLPASESDQARHVRQASEGATPSSSSTSTPAASRPQGTPALVAGRQSGSLAAASVAKPVVPKGAPGYVFVCNSRTLPEITSLKLFGSPRREYEQIKRLIGEGTELFLYNFDTSTLIGPFSANGSPGLDIVEPAWRGRFRAQVRVVAKQQPLLQARFFGSRLPAGAKSSGEVASLRRQLYEGGPADANFQRHWQETSSGSDGERKQQPQQHEAPAPTPAPAAVSSHKILTTATQPDRLPDQTQTLSNSLREQQSQQKPQQLQEVQQRQQQPQQAEGMSDEQGQQGQQQSLKQEQQRKQQEKQDQQQTPALPQDPPEVVRPTQSQAQRLPSQSQEQPEEHQMQEEQQQQEHQQQPQQTLPHQQPHSHEEAHEQQTQEQQQGGADHDRQRHQPQEGEELQMRQQEEEQLQRQQQEMLPASQASPPETRSKGWVGLFSKPWSLLGLLGRHSSAQDQATAAAQRPQQQEITTPSPSSAATPPAAASSSVDFRGSVSSGSSSSSRATGTAVMAASSAGADSGEGFVGVFSQPLAPGQQPGLGTVHLAQRQAALKRPLAETQGRWTVQTPNSPTTSTSWQPSGSDSATVVDGGYLFYCTEDTQRQCQAYNMLGTPEYQLSDMQANITSDTHLFLMNVDSMLLMGTFTPVDAPALSIVPGLFHGRLNAQVRVVPREAPLMEVKMGWKPPPGRKTPEEVEGLRDLLLRGHPAEARVQVAWSTPSLDAPPLAKRQRFVPDAGCAPSLGGFVPPAVQLHVQQHHAICYANAREQRTYDVSMVVVNFANVGATYAKKVLAKDLKKGDRLFDWEGVRKCIKHLTEELGMKVHGVCFENFVGPDNGRMSHSIPADIRSMCSSVQEAPRITGKQHKSADDEMTIKCAFRRNCLFLDNDNYRDWLMELRNVKIRRWLGDCQDMLQMRYYFDSELGTFDTLDGNIPMALLAPLPGDATAG
eukprot:TRINITY_DN26346_c0_g2_i1.p1 TRINITY_DN26346_c0_g2~~TRINITY_DN26346_c0_g2_i1.p1  ORF type:complete len:1272 (-),score=312.62 TRINITY_DN26346_c0_g2_i1:463-4278(-)